MYNEDPIYTILHFSTNIICFLILSGYSILGNEELLILNSWILQIFLYNLSNIIKVFSIYFINWFMYPILFALLLGTNDWVCLQRF